jgi:hypothetical protein
MKGLEGSELANLGMIPPELLNLGTTKALGSLYKQLGPYAEQGIGKAIIDYTRSMGLGGNKLEEVVSARGILEKSVIRPMNKRAERVRDIKTSMENPGWLTDDAMEKALAKATLDVGTLTNFANITGGQALGYVSLDTRMARGTVRPSSFTLYQALDKTLAWQVVDFWALAKATGGAPPGAAFANYSSVTSGSLATSAGTYDLLNIVLKLALDGRAITTALAAQNNYVNVSEQENTNAALTVLSTVNFASYLGDATMHPNQFDGIYKQIVNAGYASTNIFDYYQFSNNFSTAHSWSPELTLYNLIYEASAQITSYATFGHITHAFMEPVAMGALQGLTNTVLNNILNQISELQDRAPLVVNGNLIGMQTRFGHIQFPMDLFIGARNIPVEAVLVGGNSQATAANPTPPTSITATATAASNANSVGSNFNGSYTAGTAQYMYAVAAADDSMVESTLTYSASGLVTVTTGESVAVAITPNGTSATAFRVFRSGLGGCFSNASPAANEFRYVGSIRANGASVVTFYDLNGGVNATANAGLSTFIPGSTDIFLLDMDPMDLAIDYRLLLPLVRVELFANNLFMPWAVASIGSVRLRVPKFHGMIKNYVPTNPSWNPLAIN